MKLWSTELSLHNGNGNSIPFLRPASSLHCNETLLILVYFLSFSRFFFVQNMESGHQRPFKFVLDIAWTSVSAQVELSASEMNIAWTSVSSKMELSATKTDETLISCLHCLTCQLHLSSTAIETKGFLTCLVSILHGHMGSTVTALKLHCRIAIKSL